MALTFEYRPGMSLTDPWPFTVVRAGTAYRIAKDGTLAQVAANVLRDNHYPFGLGSAIRTTLFEPTTINYCLQSQTLNVTWAKTGILSVNQTATIAPDLTTTGNLVTEDTTTGNHQLVQGFTITAQEYLAVSVFVKAGTRTKGQLYVQSSPTSSDWVGISFDLGLGTVSSFVGGNGTLTGSAIIPLANGWYWIAAWGRMSGISTDTLGNMVLRIRDATGTQSYTGDGASGMYWWGAQFERNTTGAPKGASSYVPTTTGTATRNNEKCSTPWPHQTQAMWCYTSWYDLGGSIWLQSAPLLTISNSTVNTDPSWCPMFLRNNGKPGASWAGGTVTPLNGLLGSSRNTIAANAGLALVQPYDFVETFSRVLKDGSTTFEARINGGTALANGQVGPVGGIPFTDIVNATLYLGWAGALTGPQVGATCMRVGADPLRITTLALAAAA